jgi:hypothetical protein
MRHHLPRALAALAVAVASVITANGQMPDLKQMSGVPLPVGDVPTGSITVRVVRGALTSVVPNHPVDLVGGAAPVTLSTNDSGRAEFTGITPGTRVRAVTTVDGERLESREFDVPRNGGIRLLLVATDPSAVVEPPLPQAPPEPGTVVLGTESRFVFEMGEDGLSVFNIFQIMNAGRAPVQTAPLVFDLPEAAEHASVLQGSSPQAVAAGKRVTVTGPFAPGPTLVQFAYTLPFHASDLTFEQKLPAALTQVSVLVQKIGEMHVASEQFARHQDTTADGQAYIVAMGPALKAGDTLTLAFTGLPASATWPRNLAIALASVIMLAGAWMAVRPRRDGDGAARARQLHAKRDRLFAQLTDLEQQHQKGAVDDGRYTARRRELVGALERVYAELDEEAAA